MSKPDPFAQLRELLAVARHQDFTFDAAWELATAKVRYQHDTYERRTTKAIMVEHREAWLAGYHRQDVPGGKLLVALMDALGDDDDRRPAPVAVPRAVFTQPEHRKAA